MNSISLVALLYASTFNNFFISLMKLHGRERIQKESS